MAGILSLEFFERVWRAAYRRARNPVEGTRLSDREWNGLDPLLRPLAFHILQRKGIRGADAEDVHIETFAELARLRPSDRKAPIESVLLFEETVPLFSKMIGFRSIDWRRRQGALKNQPNTQHSVEELTEREDHAMQFEDERSPRGGQVGDLLEQDEIRANLGLCSRDSTSKKRRVLNDHLERAPSKLGKCLQN